MVGVKSAAEARRYSTQYLADQHPHAAGVALTVSAARRVCVCVLARQERNVWPSSMGLEMILMGLKETVFINSK